MIAEEGITINTIAGRGAGQEEYQRNGTGNNGTTVQAMGVQATVECGGNRGYRLQSWGAGHPVDTRLTLAVLRQSRLSSQSSTASPEA